MEGYAMTEQGQATTEREPKDVVVAEVTVPIYRMADNRMPGFYEGFATLGPEDDPVASVGVALGGGAFYIFLHKEPKGERHAAPVMVIRASDLVTKALAKLSDHFPSLTGAK